MYTKTTNTDDVFIYTEERAVSDSKEEISSEHRTEEDTDALLGVTMGRLGGMVWDKSSSSNKLMRNRHFLDFVDTASTIMSSALNSDHTTKPMNVFSSAGKAKTTSLLQKKGSYLSETAARDQMVIVAIAFQPGSTDTFAVSYGTGEHPGSTLDSRLQDVVLTWSTRRSAPVPFQFRYEIHSLSFTSLHPHYLFGGSSKGHVVLWDTRSNSSPIAVTFPSLNSHNMPITYLKIVGDSSRNTLTSVSLDGRVCMWNIDDLKHPVASVVIYSSHVASMSMSLTASCIPQMGEGKDVEASRVYLASPKGELYVASRAATDRKSTASLVSKGRHEGSINSIDCHPQHPTDSSISNLILTASSDWSCRIWLGEASVKICMQDMVLDAKWSPTNAEIFAACDAGGRLTIWNVAQSIQTPVGTLLLEDSTAPGGKGPVILHRLAWDDSGENVIVGGNQGESYYIAVNLKDTDANGGDALKQWVSRSFVSSN
eukprot:GILI01020744.1.p1 GENE.GILI01020744.1~~GILI01020744.1.p1  ORF type:complete len:540 (-),score=43.86 GILI01020744.1:46-1497(-)